MSARGGCGKNDRQKLVVDDSVKNDALRFTSTIVKCWPTTVGRDSCRWLTSIDIAEGLVTKVFHTN